MKGKKSIFQPRKLEGKRQTFLALAAAIGRTGRTGWVIGSVTGGGGGDGAVVVVTKRTAGRRGGAGASAGEGGQRGGGRGRGEAPHARTLLHGPRPFHQPHPKEAHAPSPRRARPRVVPVVATVRTPPRHLRPAPYTDVSSSTALRSRRSRCTRPRHVDLSVSAEGAASKLGRRANLVLRRPLQ